MIAVLLALLLLAANIFAWGSVAFFLFCLWDEMKRRR